MQKDFDKWNSLKQKIGGLARNFYVKKKDVVWIHLGMNVGDEENGKGDLFLRPVLVLKVFNSNIFYGVPMSSKIKGENKFYLQINVNYQDKLNDKILSENRSLLLSHGRLFDTKRIINRYGRISEEDFLKTKSAVCALLFSDQDFSGSRPSPICNTSIAQSEILSSSADPEIVERHVLIPAGYVILKKENQVLLSRRFNTGYHDGDYSLPAGHVESGETFLECGTRELFEEAGVVVKESDLKLVHIMHRYSGKNEIDKRIDVFYFCEKWEGEIVNKEINKCDDLKWCDIGNLPENTIPYIKIVFENIKKNIFFSEI